MALKRQPAQYRSAAFGKRCCGQFTSMTFKREDGCMTAAIESVADLCERLFRKLAAEIHSKGAWLCDRINPASPGYLCSCEAKLPGNRSCPIAWCKIGRASCR